MRNRIDCLHAKVPIAPALGPNAKAHWTTKLGTSMWASSKTASSTGKASLSGEPTRSGQGICIAVNSRKTSATAMSKGTFTWPNGDQYLGEYKNGKRNGKGTYTFAKGKKYVGEFKDGKMHGKGISTFANGDRYVGEFQDNQMTGWGAYTRADGSQQVGEFKKAQLDGLGIEYSSPNSIKSSGRFHEDKLLESMPLDPKRFAYVNP